MNEVLDDEGERAHLEAETSFQRAASRWMCLKFPKCSGPAELWRTAALTASSRPWRVHGVHWASLQLRGFSCLRRFDAEEVRSALYVRSFKREDVGVAVLGLDRGLST